MRQFNKFANTKGFVSTWYQVLRFRYMITEQAKYRCRVLAFWEKHGIEATKEAFHLSQRTLYRWQRALRQNAGKLDGLNPKSTAPLGRRKRIIADDLKRAIILLRTKHPHLGKDKLQPLLLKQDFNLSVSTLGRMLNDLKKKGELPIFTSLSVSGRTGRLLEKNPKKRKKKLRRPKGYRVLEVDTIVRYIHGVKRYILTAVDTETRIAFASGYTNHGSASAANFLQCTREVIPDFPLAIQTDNGSEFALHFEQACHQLNLTHYHTYPKSPKMNAHIERFNRTLNEEFLAFHKALLRDDVRIFNQKLIDWLLWYNGERPHYALHQKSPFQHFVSLSLIPSQKCQMWWTHTNA